MNKTKNLKNNASTYFTDISLI